MIFVVSSAEWQVNSNDQELDVVRLKKDLPEQDLMAGAEGTVQQVYNDNPPAYLVEFTAEDGLMLALWTVPEDVLEVIWTAPPTSRRPQSVR